MVSDLRLFCCVHVLLVWYVVECYVGVVLCHCLQVYVVLSVLVFQVV